ncbi:MAG: 16S rRNA (uracil(1498)-N(3))-methyltransferase [Pyrinomonadaceae bacterium]
MRRFFAPRDNIDDSVITLDASETRHLRDVLRLKKGDAANVFDGTGGEYSCIVDAVEKQDTRLTILEKVPPSAPESPLELTLAACQLPGDKFDLLVQKAVELGVKRLVPLYSIRTEVRSSGAERRRGRWEKIALGAAKQCGRATLMSIDAPVAFADFAISPGADSTVYFFSERDGQKLPPVAPGKKITAFVGPKGGWDDSEIALAREQDFAIITLGGRVLRAETAAITFAAILQHRLGDVN